jgi:hypothetical protein
MGERKEGRARSEVIGSVRFSYSLASPPRAIVGLEQSEGEKIGRASERLPLSYPFPSPDRLWHCRRGVRKGKTEGGTDDGGGSYRSYSVAEPALGIVSVAMR